MKNQIAKLKSLGLKKLPTLNLFLDIQHNKLVKSTDEYTLYKGLREFAEALKQEPQPTDFINYDIEGNFIKGNKPIFKGWVVCQQTSSETKKVAKLVTDKTEHRIYFGTADGVVVMSMEHVADKLNYSELANYFENELKLS